VSHDQANSGGGDQRSPIVSVIVPTYNRGEMVGQAIDSVLTQTFTDFELIVVDDGSTDDTEVRVRNYGDLVRYVRTENGGVAHARNVGARQAKGRYLTFLDSDDLLYRYALELEVRLLDRFTDAGLACAEMSAFTDTGPLTRYYLQTYHRSAYRDPSINYAAIFGPRARLQERIEVPGALLQEDPQAADRGVYVGNVFDTYLLNLVLCQNSVMYRRSLIEQVGERNVAVKHWQEVDYLLRITRHHNVCFVDVPTYKMRFHAGQISSTAQRNGAYVWMRKQQILLRVIKRHALADTAYYAQNRRRIHAQLAHLHRAVAVPMLMQPARGRGQHRWAAFARRYIRRCSWYGRPAWLLHLAALSPAPLRRFAVRCIESSRQLWWSLIWSARSVRVKRGPAQVS
jgi:glycosyltransferase involved in cell wall biosynthesis